MEPKEKTKEEESLNSKELPKTTQEIEVAHQEIISDATAIPTEATQIEKSLQKLKLKEQIKLGGAARKRFKWLVKHGADPKEAREQAIKPVGGAKRQRSEDSTPSPLTKRSKGENKTPNDPNSSSGTEMLTYKQAAEGTRVGILSADFPATALTLDQMTAVKEAILTRVLKLQNEGIKPGFSGITPKPGWLVITCKDEATVEWLKTIAAELKPWEGASLKAVMGEELPRLQILTGYFPDSAKNTTDEVQQYLENQNQAIKAKSWKVISKLPEKDMLRVTFSVDFASVTVLKKLNYRLSYKFGQVQLKPSTTGSVKSKGVPPKSSRPKKQGKKDRGAARKGAKLTAPAPSTSTKP